MKSMKRGLAVLLAVLLIMPTLPVKADAAKTQPADGPGYEESLTGADAGGEASGGTGGAVHVPETGADSGGLPGTDAFESGEGFDVSGNDALGSGEGEGAVDGTPKEGLDVSGNDASDPGPLPEYGNAGVVYSTGGEYRLIINPSVSENEGGSGVFEADGSYTIQIPEEDPFFPYEVQFVDPESGEAQNQWFMTPDSAVEFGGHTFRVAANFTGNVVTQFSLNIAGDVVVAYPAEKEFGGAEPMSLLPLKEVYLDSIDLNGYTPLELTMVSVESVFTGDTELKDTDRIMWTTRYSSGSSADVPDYTVSQRGDCINLSYAHSVQMIVGEPDQLAADNVRYTAYLNKSDYDGWLTPFFYTQAEDGTRTAVEVKQDYYSYSSNNVHGSRFEYGYENISLSSKQGNISEGYLALQINSGNYAKTRFTSVKAYEGLYETAAEAMAAEEITNRIFTADMSGAGAGYQMKRSSNDITLVSFDTQGNVTGCLPVRIYCNTVKHGVYVDWMRNASGNDITSGRSYEEKDGCLYYTQRLYSGNPANGNYVQTFMYYDDGTVNNGVITAAYAGHYASIAEATAAGAQDVKDTLFREESYSYDNFRGYAGDFSAGIDFTIFIGADGTEGQQVLKYNIKTVTNDAAGPNSNAAGPNSNTSVTFEGLRDAGGLRVNSVKLLDSYAENNYVVFLVNEDVDRSNLALIFYPDDNPKLYAEGSSTPETSGESYHDFSKGALQFTAAAEDGENAKNYWVQVVTRAEAEGRIFMNSLADSSVETRVEGGVIYTSREVMLDYVHDYKHDIMLANMGTEAIEALSAELVSDVVELDDYWVLTGNHALSGFTNTDRNTSYGKLSNLAMLRLRGKEGVEDGTDITGTLTIKSGTATLMVITLTGTIGDPSITTKEVPEAVKYVPYGTMIQNSNKYSWNTVRYEVWEGELPGGMVVRPNGELYGVPTEVGEFTFTVRMTNSYSSFGSSFRQFTLVVQENTDANVEGQTDLNYELTERVTYDYNSGLGDQLMVSQGEYGEFVALWLDGVKLTEGVDYTSESGSTRITIASQTLEGNKAQGTHTLGVEFRTTDNNTLRRAAQNYVLDGKGSFEDGNNDSGNDDNSDNDGNDSSSGNSGSTSGGSGTAAAESTVISYTVQKGDTLWKIAVKFFGDGNQWRKIYEDNKDVLGNPDRIYAGQVLKIIVTTASGSQETVPAAGGTYTVQPGDSLWKIAVKAYGNGRRWTKIYEANKDRISDASRIRVGQVLVIPE